VVLLDGWMDGWMGEGFCDFGDVDILEWMR